MTAPCGEIPLHARKCLWGDALSKKAGAPRQTEWWWSGYRSGCARSVSHNAMDGSDLDRFAERQCRGSTSSPAGLMKTLLHLVALGFLLCLIRTEARAVTVLNSGNA